VWWDLSVVGFVDSLLQMRTEIKLQQHPAAANSDITMWEDSRRQTFLVTSSHKGSAQLCFTAHV